MCKKLLFVLVALLVAINSWGYAVNEVIKAYDPGTDTESDDFLFYVIKDDASDHTCGLLQCNLSGDIVVPGSVYTKSGVTFKVVKSSPDTSSSLASNYPKTFMEDVQSLTFSENLTTLQCQGWSNATFVELHIPSTVSKVSVSSINLPNLRKLTVASSNTTFKVMETVEGASILVDSKGVASFIVFRDENGDPVTELTFPYGIVSLSGLNFYGGNTYKKVEKVTLPSTFKSFEATPSFNRHAFYAAGSGTRIKEFAIAEDNPYLCVYDGCIYKKPFAVVDGETKPWGETLLLIPEGKDFPGGEFSLPEGVKAIGDCACIYMKATKVVVPEGVETIGAAAFGAAGSLKSITIPASASSIGDAFLGNATKLEEIIVADGNPLYSTYNGVLYSADYKTLISCPAAKTGDYSLHAMTEVIGDNAFQSSKLSNLNLKSAPNLQKISRYSLSQMSNLTSLEIPASVRTIEYNAIASALVSKMTFEHTDDPTAGLTLADYWTGGGVRVDEIVFPSHLVSLGGTGRSVIPAKKVSFEEGSRLTQLGRLEASLNKNVEEVDLSNCTLLTTLQANSFANLQNLKTIKLPASIKTFGNQCFFDTPALEEIVFAEGTQLETIGANTFQDCGIQNITLPESVVSVGREAFVRCTNLKKVNIPASATYVHPEAFKYCNNLVEFDVDDNNTVYASPDGMLTSRDKKELILFPAGKASSTFTILAPSFEKIGAYAFYYCQNLENIVIPKKVKSIGNYAFQFCDNLNSITFLTDGPLAQLDADVKSDNAKSDPNLKDHRFGNAAVSAREFLKNNVTINIRRNGREDEYKDPECYWCDCSDYTYSFRANASQSGNDSENSYEFLAMSDNTVGVLKSFSTNATAVVPEKIKNPENGREYSVGMIGDYAFEDAPASVKEIVFFGPIQYVGSNAFNDGHKDGVYKPSPTSSIENIFFTNSAIGASELSTARFELGAAYGTDEYPEFASSQKIYVQRSVEGDCKQAWATFADQISYQLPFSTPSAEYSTFSREFAADFSANGNSVANPKFIAFASGEKKTLGDTDYIVMHSINEGAAGDGTFIPANTGVVFKTYESAPAYYEIASNQKAAPVAGVVVPVLSETTVAPGTGTTMHYYIGKNDGKAHLISSAITIGAHKAYIRVNGMGAKNLQFSFATIDELVNGIDEIKMDSNSSDAIYNLNGQRVNNVVRGIYVRGGKKFMVK